MGLLTTLLTLPVTGPLKGVAWIAEQVADLAEEELAHARDPRRDLAALERARAFGQITEEEYRREEAALWARIQDRHESQERNDGL